MYFYIHIPFCRKRCLYCKFALTTQIEPKRIQRYISALKSEIQDRVKKDIGWESISLGGGTPSVLSIEDLKEILLELYGVTGKNREESLGELCIEANPEDITEEYAFGLQELGVNRVSLGVQTLSSDSLQEIGRRGTESIFSACENLEKAGHKNINIDTILGLPKSNFGEILKTIQCLHETFEINHTSVYFLEKGHYPAGWKKNQISEELIRKEYELIRSYLESRGFYQYEISNFARKGFESQHNLAYWEDREVLGLGLSASSRLGNIRRENSLSFAEYENGNTNFVEEILSEESRELERNLCRLRTFQGVKKDSCNPGKWREFVSEGLLREQGNEVFLTPAGIFLIDYIISELL